MLRLNRILGQASDPAFFDRLHELQHHGHVERILIGVEDAARHRLRVRTDAGTECAIALTRDQRLANGSILLLEEDRAILIAIGEVLAQPMIDPDDPAGSIDRAFQAIAAASG